MRVAVLLVLMWVALNAAAQEGGARVQPKDFNNGCGPAGLLGALIPEEVGRCTFGKACAEHDNCYSGCEPGGPREGTDYCKLPKDHQLRQTTKASCDADFGKILVATNEESGACKRLARFYEFMVTTFGGTFFNGRRINPQLLDQSWTPEELNQFRLRGLLLFEQAERGSIKASDIVVGEDGDISVRARSSLRTKLKIGDELRVPSTLVLSKELMAPLIMPSVKDLSRSSLQR